MPNTGERREITGRVNAKEAEMVQESKKLVAKTKQGSANTDAKNMERSAAKAKRAVVSQMTDTSRSKRG